MSEAQLLRWNARQRQIVARFAARFLDDTASQAEEPSSAAIGQARLALQSVTPLAPAAAEGSDAAAAASALCARLRGLEPAADSSGAAAESPPFPKLGVSLALLRLLGSLVPAGETTAEACVSSFKPLTARARCSVADAVARLGLSAPNGAPYVAPATVFASHAWRYEFALLLAALEAFAEAQPAPEQVYVWFDCLTVNQHATATLPQEWWSTAFAAGIREIGHTCLVLAPWRSPVPLTRAWCLWELLCSVESGARLTVQLPPSEAAGFAKALVAEFESIATSMAAIDVRKAEAFKAEDEQMIRRAVELGAGFTVLNKLVSGQLRQWLAREARQALDGLPAAARATSALINNLGRLLQDQGKLDEALPLYEEALRGRRETLGDRHPGTLVSINNLGLLLQGQGKLDEALPLLEEALRGSRETLGDRHPNTLLSIGTLGALLMDQGKLDEALPLFEETLRGSRETLGDRHQRTLTSVSNLGRLLQLQGKLDEALPLFEEALRGFRETLGVRHPDTLTSINNLGMLLMDQGKLDEALPLFEEVLRGMRETLGDRHPRTLTSINNLGTLLQHQRKLDEALPLCEEALRGRRETLGDRHPDTLGAINNLGMLLQAQGKLDEALPQYEEALRGKRETLGDRHPDTLTSINTLGRLLQGQGKLDEALPLYEEALRGKRETLGDRHPSTLISINNLGLLLQGQGKLDEALPLLEEALRGLRETLGDRHPNTLTSINNLGSLLKSLGRRADALVLLRELCVAYGGRAPSALLDDIRELEA